jgi:hypothetical protein
MDIEKPEHVDLEQKFQISAKVDFESSQEEFTGLGDIQIEIKKKKKTEPAKIQNIELRKSKSSNSGLF